MSIDLVEPGPDELEVRNLRADISRGACFKKGLPDQPGALFPVALQEGDNAELALGAVSPFLVRQLPGQSQHLLPILLCGWSVDLDVRVALRREAPQSQARIAVDDRGLEFSFKVPRNLLVRTSSKLRPQAPDPRICCIAVVAGTLEDLFGVLV